MPQIKAVIGADTRAYNREMGKARKGVIDLQSTVKAVGAAMASYFAADTLISFSKSLVDTSIKLEQIAQKSSVVFGAFNQEVNKAAGESANKIGLTASEFKEAAVAAADLLIPMGFTRREATNMSIELIKLSGALSNWSAGKYDSAQVSEILTKAMLGEREQLKSLGISISENDVKMALAKKGQENLTGASEEQAKALATLELILSKSTDAQTAFASGAQTTAMKLQQSKAAYKEFGETLSALVDPIIGGLTAAFDGLQNVIGSGITVTNIKNPYSGKDVAELEKMLKIFTALRNNYAGNDEMFSYYEKYRIAVNMVNMAIAEQTVEEKKVIETKDKTKKKTKDLTDAVQKYHGVLGDINYELENLNKQQQNATSDAELMRINGRIDALKEQKKLYEDIGSLTRMEAKPGQVSGSKTLPVPALKTSVAIGDAPLTAMQEWRKEMGTLKDYGEVVSQSLQNSMVSMASGIGQAFGDLLSGTITLGGFFESIMGMVGTFLQSFGEALIAASVAAIAFQQLLLNPWAALAAGIALVAAGAIVKNLLSAGPGGGDGVQKFADGGVIFGPTLGLMGEYAGASNNPEVVAPLSDLQAMLGLGGDSIALYGQLSGNDILISNDRSNYSRNRLRGR